MKTLIYYLVWFALSLSLTPVAYASTPQTLDQSKYEEILLSLSILALHLSISTFDPIEILEKVPQAEAEEKPLKEVISDYILHWSEKRGIPGKKVLAIAQCESQLNPQAINKKDTDGRPKYGLFQFDKNTFVGEDILDWQKQTEQATLLMSQGKWGKWPYCHRNYLKYL